MLEAGSWRKAKSRARVAGRPSTSIPTKCACDRPTKDVGPYTTVPNGGQPTKHVRRYINGDTREAAGRGNTPVPRTDEGAGARMCG